MKFGLLLALLLVLCVAVFSQELPIGERPSSSDSSVEIDNPEKPNYSSDNPERPSSSESSSSSSDSNSIASHGDQSEDSDQGTACIALAMECPDHTYATQNAECDYICGAPPTGNLNWTYVDSVKQLFIDGYHPIGIYVGDMKGKNILLHSPEKKSDLCLEVTISMDDFKVYPAVFNGVRVFYTKISDEPLCSPTLCPDGSLVGCNDVCEEDEGSHLFTPFALVFGVVLMSACCCCIRRRRCKAKCNQQAANLQSVSSVNAYPAEYYELLQQEQALADPSYTTEMPPQMMAQPMIFPPMPPIPPHMLQQGAFPVMMQAPNGVWYMAPPHSEEA